MAAFFYGMIHLHQTPTAKPQDRALPLGQAVLTEDTGTADWRAALEKACNAEISEHESAAITPESEVPAPGETTSEVPEPETPQTVELLEGQEGDEEPHIDHLAEAAAFFGEGDEGSAFAAEPGPKAEEIPRASRPEPGIESPVEASGGGISDHAEAAPLVHTVVAEDGEAASPDTEQDLPLERRADLRKKQNPTEQLRLPLAPLPYTAPAHSTGNGHPTDAAPRAPRIEVAPPARSGPAPVNTGGSQTIISAPPATSPASDSKQINLALLGETTLSPLVSGPSGFDPGPVASSAATGSAPGATALPDPRTPAIQIAVSVAKAEGDTVELSLSPEELGRVRISISSSETGVSLMLFAERDDTQHLLRRHLGELVSALRHAGISDANIGFGQSGSEERRDAPPQARHVIVPGGVGFDPMSPLSDPAPTRPTSSGLDLRF